MRYGLGPFAHGVMFHHFHGDIHPVGQGSMSAADLDEMIGFIGLERILPADEWMRRSLAGELKSNDLCLTFDDALRCQFDIAFPILQKYGLTAFWFIYSSVFEGNSERLEIYRYFRSVAYPDTEDFYIAFNACLDASPWSSEVSAALRDFRPETYLSDFSFYTDSDRTFRFIRDRVLGQERYFHIMDSMVDEAGLDRSRLAAMLWMRDDHLLALKAAGHIVGLHSYSHPTTLCELPVEMQRREYSRNHRHLTDVLNTPPRAVSHPCNSYSQETMRLLNELGIQVGFRSNMALPAGSLLEQPRIDHTYLLKDMGCR